jgi:hypothetical protein
MEWRDPSRIYTFGRSNVHIFSRKGRDTLIKVNHDLCQCRLFQKSLVNAVRIPEPHNGRNSFNIK